jgi:hypothetical protein
MAETALIAVDIDLDMVNRRLAQTGELTAKEARDIERNLKSAYQRAARASEDAAKQMARAQSKAARDAEREAKRAAREIERSFDEQTSAVRGLASAAFGGVAGDLLDVADATSGVSVGMGAIGVALGALAVGVPVLQELAVATLEMGRTALEARDAIEQEGLAVEDLIAPASLTALDQYEQSQRDLGVAVNLAKIEIAQGLLPALRDLDTLLIGFTPHAELVGQGIGVMVEAAETTAISTLTTSLNNFIPGAGTAAAAALELGSSYLTAEGEARKLELQTQRVADRNAEVEFQLHEMLQAQKRSNEEAARDYAIKQRNAEAAAKSAAATRDNAAAVSQYQAAVAAGTITVADNTAAIEEQRAAAEQLRQQQQLITETAQGLREEMRLAAEEQANEETSLFGPMVTQIGETVEAMTMLGDSFGGILGNLEQLRAAQQRQHEDRVNQLRDERAESRNTYRNALAEYEASRENMTAAEQAAAEAELALLATNERAHRKVLRELEKEERDAAMKAYRRQKALQLVQIAIDGARNAVALTAAFAYAGPWAPVIASGIAGTQAGIAAALVEAQPPPQFHFGTTAVSASLSGNGGAVGIPGAEVPAVLEQGEGVVSRRGMATPGMAELVEALNAGRAPTGRSMVSDIEADLLAQRLNRPYAPAIRGRALAGTNTFYRGR